MSRAWRSQYWSYIEWDRMVQCVKDLSGVKHCLTELKSFAFLADVAWELRRDPDNLSYKTWLDNNYAGALQVLKDLTVICNPNNITKIGRLVAPIPIPAERLAMELNLFPNLAELDLFGANMGGLYSIDVSTKNMDQYVRELALRCPRLAKVTSEWGPSVVYSISRENDTPELTRNIYEDPDKFDSIPRLY
jgi:hypothetical protein